MQECILLIVMILVQNETLTVRRFCPSDLNSLYELLSDADVMQHIEPPYSKQQTEEFMRRVGMCESPLIYAVENKEGNFVGYVIYHKYEVDGMEIGWVLNKCEWGKGYADMLTKMLVADAVLKAKYAVIECSTLQQVTKHIAVKNRFVFEKTENNCDIFKLYF